MEQYEKWLAYNYPGVYREWENKKVAEKTMKVIQKRSQR